MNTLGLKAEKIDELLKNNGIVEENINADVIRKAIVNVITENNKEIAKHVSDLVSEELVKTMKLRGYNRNVKSYSI